jgi:hypothetical protein
MDEPAKISVKFILDEEGNPLTIEGSGKRHYKILVYAERFPEDVYSVEYRLHPSYINPYRVQDNKAGNFEFKTTTYGDYSISASLMGSKQNYIASCIISQALKENNGNSANPRVQEAIMMIRGN